MGLVYRAYHVQLARTGAVKIMQGIAPDEDSIARFRREAQAIAQMRHANILNVFDFGEFEGTPYMIVEYVPGGNLAGRLTLGPLDRNTALRFLRGIGAGLDYAHSQGIVHRDVKPANVLLERDETPVLADFGLAKLMQGSSVKSLTGVTTGTPAYMAPEQVTGTQVGPAADRYSLAVMAYEMLTGALPFDEGGVLEVLYAQVHKEPVPPSMLDHKLPPKVDAVIMRGMSKEPAARWERCRDFVTALENAFTPTPAAEKTVTFAPPAPRAPKPSSVARPARAAADMTAVMAADEAAGPIRGPDPALPIPKVTWKGTVVPGHAASRRSRAPLAFVVGAIVLILLLLAGAAAYYVTQPPSLTLSRYTVSGGERITVTAAHLPPDQLAEIWILSLSNPYVYQFRADAIGRATRRSEEHTSEL